MSACRVNAAVSQWPSSEIRTQDVARRGSPTLLPMGGGTSEMNRSNWKNRGKSVGPFLVLDHV